MKNEYGLTPEQIFETGAQVGSRYLPLSRSPLRLLDNPLMMALVVGGGLLLVASVLQERPPPKKKRGRKK